MSPAARRACAGATRPLAGMSARALRALGAEDSRLDDDVRRGIDALPPADRAAWFR